GSLTLAAGASLPNTPTITLVGSASNAGRFDVSAVTGGFVLGGTAAQTLTGEAGPVNGAVTVGANGTLRAGSATGVAQMNFTGGSLAFASTGTCVVDVYSTGVSQNGRAAVVGPAAVAGTIRLSLLNGVTPDALRTAVGAGNTRDYVAINTTGGVTGTFATSDFSTAGFQPGEWTVVYTANNVILRFTPVPEPGP